jgi:hypothetical protein
MKRAHPLIFWPQFVWETVRKHVALAGAIMRLAAAAYGISRDPAPKLYVDQALTPVGAAEEATLDLFTKTACGTAAVAHVRRVAVLTHATAGSKRQAPSAENVPFLGSHQQTSRGHRLYQARLKRSGTCGYAGRQSMSMSLPPSSWVSRSNSRVP